ncbi:homoserine dehydrogenase [bacterium]|nr:homoserine dehydrogenase [bacterium]
MKKQINVGLCGLGTVGAGTAELLQKNSDIIEKRTGFRIQVTRAATIDPYDHLDVDFSNIKVTDSVSDVINDPEIDIVVELIGGDGIAKKIILEAFAKGKSVVTANKALLAKHSEEIFKAAYQSEGLFGFEASVGGGIPIIRSIKEGFSGDRIEGFSGIINGTANYILSSMTKGKADFSTALKSAQEKGFAEADPTFDIEGIDTAHKVIILMDLAFNGLFDFNQVHIEGITGIKPIDIELADKLGYQIKLLGKAKQGVKGFEGRVHPSLVKSDSMLAAVNGPFNAISVIGNFVGHTMSYGAGAGSHPTASAVVGDMIEISRNLMNGNSCRVLPLTVAIENLQKMTILPIDEIESEYYLRFLVKQPWEAINAIRDAFYKEELDIQQVEQLDGEQADACFVLAVLTGKMEERAIQGFIKDLETLPFNAFPIKLIRVEP